MKKLSLPKDLKLVFKKYKDLRYGENPHQKSAFYFTSNSESNKPSYISNAKPGFEQLWGIELSHNNLTDANHAWGLVSEFSEPTVTVIKHGNPSGITSRTDIAEAFNLAYGADSVSAFGGIVALNCEPTMEMVEAMRGKFFEILVAPRYSREVLERLKRRSKRMRVIKADKIKRQLEFVKVFNGYLAQTPDDILEQRKSWKVVSGKKPSGKILDDLEFAWKVVKHVHSNAIVVARDKSMCGMGTGQPNRVNSVKLALGQSKDKASGAVMASDAFFPFPDNVVTAARAGIKVILQPGGSIKDEEVIEAARKHKVTMVFTGVRHFKH